MKESRKPRKAASPNSTARTDSPQLGTLYLVPTPIGNLGDITERALEVLKSVDAIAAEDTRNTGQLLKLYGIEAELIACHDHNEESIAPNLIEKLKSGQNIALVSDAGTPLVSDPGYRIVAAVIEANLPITALPGANAVLPALQLSGLPPHPFYFGGFLPTRDKAQHDVLASLVQLQATLVFYEAPHRLAEMLANAASVLGLGRRAAVVREISKKFETAKRGILQNLKDFYAHEEARGEIVVVIEGAKGTEKWPEALVCEALASALTHGTAFREAVIIISAQSGWPKSMVYDLAIKLKANDPT